ncbi:MAG: DegV family protein [Chloroflexi bacterium]|nr:DegV family protein [Chloroflexota bacterium]
MPKVGIVTDSTNCLPAELIKEYDVRVVPYHIIMEGKDYRDRIDITPAEFWQRFSSLKEIPTTGVPSPAELINIFNELAKSTDNIVCIHISKAISAIYETVNIAKETVMEQHPNLKIDYIDSRNSAGALGFIVLEAARAAQAGKSSAEIIKIAQDLVPKVKLMFALDTLKYLIKGGRAPKTAVIGEFLQVKPIIHIDSDTGLVTSLGKERSKRKAMLKMVDMVQDYTDTSNPLHVIVHYTDCIEDGIEFRAMITSRYNCTDEVYLTDLTPVMTVHTGPAVGLSFYS